jgi:hypothetical protein
MSDQGRFTMKLLVLATVALAAGLSASQTSPNSTQYDNYGAKGNYNPYTGNTGTKPPKY